MSDAGPVEASLWRLVSDLERRLAEAEEALAAQISLSAEMAAGLDYTKENARKVSAWMMARSISANKPTAKHNTET